MEKSPFRHATVKTLLIIAVVILCLYPFKFILKRQPYPLLLYVTAHDSDNASFVYKKINQVFATISNSADGPYFKLSHSVPNFESYSVRINRQGAWRYWHAHEIRAESAPDGMSTLEIKAHNRLGGETSVFTYSLSRHRDAAPGPHASSAFYKFEDWQAPGVELYRRYTGPVVAGRTLTWDRAKAVFDWASGFLTAGNEEKKPHFRSAAILQERLENPHSRFLCGSFAAFFVAACHSIGVNARLLHLKSRNGNGHFVAEVWSDQHQKWIVMDPMFKRFFCDDNTCFSALDMRNAYLTSINGHPAALANPPETAYFSLFDDIHYCMSNTFFTSPPTTFWNLIAGSPPVIHWRDAQTPLFNKRDGLRKLLLFYYLPRLLDAAIIPASLLVLGCLLAAAWRRFKKTA